MRHNQAVFRIIEWSACIFVGGVFFVAAWSKLRDPLAFALSLDQFRMLPDFLVNPAAVFLPWIELVLAVALWFVPTLRRDALALAGLFLLLFTTALSLPLLRGEKVYCGCFGSSTGAVTWWDVGRNFLLLLLIGSALIARPIEKIHVRRMRASRSSA